MNLGGSLPFVVAFTSKGTPTSKHPITKLQTIIGGTTGSPNDTSALVTGWMGKMPGLVVCIAGPHLFLSCQNQEGVAGMSAWACRQGRGGTGLFAPNNPRSITLSVTRGHLSSFLFNFIQFAEFTICLFTCLILIQVFLNLYGMYSAVIDLVGKNIWWRHSSCREAWHGLGKPFPWGRAVCFPPHLLDSSSFTWTWACPHRARVLGLQSLFESI